jgi:hypothetical protein
MRMVWRVGVTWYPLIGLFSLLPDAFSFLPNWSFLCGCIAALAIGFVAARRASRARSRGRAVGWTALAGALAWGAIRVIDVILGGFPLVALDAASIGMQALILGGWYSLLALFLYAPPSGISHERIDQAIAAAGIWAATPSALVELADRPVDTSLRVYFQLLFLLALPLGVAGLAVRRIVARRRWLRRVEQGQIPLWQMLETAEPRHLGLPLLVGCDRSSGRVLALVGGDAPFREVGLQPMGIVSPRRLVTAPKECAPKEWVF